MTVELKDYVLVKVNKGAHDFSIIGSLYKDSTQMLWYNDFYGHDASCEKQLPKGNYQIIGLAKDLAEEQWKEIVSHNTTIHNTWFRDYGYKMGNKKPDTVFQFDNATESGHSLLKHHKLEESNTLVLKKVL